MEDSTYAFRLYVLDRATNMIPQLIQTALLTFYVQTWDEYHTHTLTLGVISGPVEGILTLCIVYATTAVLGGGSFWQRSLLESVHVPHYSFIPNSVYNLAWNEWYMVYGGVVLVFNTVTRLGQSYSSRRSTLS